MRSLLTLALVLMSTWPISANSQTQKPIKYYWHPEFIQNGLKSSDRPDDKSFPDHWLSTPWSDSEVIALRVVKPALGYLTSLSVSCTYVGSIEGNAMSGISIVIRELHNNECGGDLMTAPIVAIFEVVLDIDQQRAFLKNYDVVEGELELAAVVHFGS